MAAHRTAVGRAAGRKARQPPSSGHQESVERLSSNQCWDLLRQVSVGRLAVWVDDHPDIFPLTCSVDHGTLVFDTDEGTKLGGALGDTPVAFEADGVDATSGMAWSVVGEGKAAAVKGIEDVLDTSSLYLSRGRRDDGWIAFGSQVEPATELAIDFGVVAMVLSGTSVASTEVAAPLPVHVPVVADQSPPTHCVTVTCSPLVPSVVRSVGDPSETVRLRFLPSRSAPCWRLTYRFTTSPGARLETAWLKPVPLFAIVRLRMPLLAFCAVVLERWRSARRKRRGP